MKPNFLLQLFLLFLILCSSAFALGITPGKHQLQFTPGSEQDVTVTVINDEHRTFDVVVYAEGPLHDYLTFSQDKIHFTPDMESVPLTYHLKLPQQLDPGVHLSQIIVREVHDQKVKGAISVQALVAVASLLQVNVPAEGLQAKFSLFIPESEPGETVKILLSATNIGTTYINKIYAVLYILDQDGKEITQLHFENNGLGQENTAELLALWTPHVSEGTYRAVAVVHYDWKADTLEQEFIVGKFALKPLDISVKDFTLGSIAKFNVLVENTKDAKIERASTEINLGNEQGTSVADFKSSEEQVQGHEKKPLISYWDTEQVQEGSYSGKLILEEDERKNTKRIRTTVTQRSLEAEIIGITGKAIALTGTQLSDAVLKKNAFYMLGLVFIIIINIIGIFVMKKRSKPGPSSPSIRDQQASTETFKRE